MLLAILLLLKHKFRHQFPGIKKRYSPVKYDPCLDRLETGKTEHEK